MVMLDVEFRGPMLSSEIATLNSIRLLLRIGHPYGYNRQKNEP